MPPDPNVYFLNSASVIDFEFYECCNVQQIYCIYSKLDQINVVTPSLGLTMIISRHKPNHIGWEIGNAPLEKLSGKTFTMGNWQRLIQKIIPWNIYYGKPCLQIFCPNTDTVFNYISSSFQPPTLHIQRKKHYSHSLPSTRTTCTSTNTVNRHDREYHKY